MSSCFINIIQGILIKSILWCVYNKNEGDYKNTYLILRRLQYEIFVNKDKKNKFTYCLILIELTIAIYFIITEIDALYNTFSAQVIAPTLIEYDYNKILNLKYDYNTNEREDVEKCRDEISSAIKKDIQTKTVINYCSELFYNYMNPKFKSLSMDGFKPNKDYVCNCKHFDEDINLLKKLDIVEGRNFNKNDFHNKSSTVPIIVGESFAKEYNVKVNNTYSTQEYTMDDSHEEIKINVIGIMKNGIRFPNEDITEERSIGEYTDSDNLVLIPFFNDFKSASSSTEQYILLENENDIAKAR